MIPSNKLFAIGLIALIVVLSISFLFPELFDSFDKTFLKLEYRLRGESKIDSSIVILYLSNDDIEALGGLPLKRTYYALTIAALKEVGAKVIGVDVAFSDENIKHPEYDILLSTVIKNADNVVLSCYFKNIGIENKNSIANLVPDQLTYKNILDLNWQKGSQISLPYSKLLFNAKSIGHTHIDETSIPLFIQTNRNLIPAFALEIFREALRVPRVNVFMRSNNLKIQSVTNEFEIPFDKNGNTTINFVGSSKSLNTISIVNFLKSYDDFKRGFRPSIPIENFRDKIVLIGIIAEGRSKFVVTPYDEEFPAIGLHAMFLHNVLHNKFLVGYSVFLKYLIIILIGSVNILFINLKKKLNRWIGVILLTVLYILVILILFYTMHFILPIAPVIFTIVLITLSTYIYHQRVIKANVAKIIDEKEALNNLLKNKELELQKLEYQLTNLQVLKDEEQKIQLEKEIQHYQREVQRLKDLSSDLQPVSMPDGEDKGVRKEYSGIIYCGSGPMEEVVLNIKKVAESDATVLIMGESGTGKELVARALHKNSKRSDKPFIAVNCGALSETLLESELFGHEKGAFTGAIREKIGRFELADGGTIFLDEIGDVSEAFQIKLLRIIQDGTFERVGGVETKKVNVRIIAATNKDLKQEVLEKNFREDLYYRLNVFTIKIPPLRERFEDIPILVEYFLNMENPEIQCSVGVMNILKQYPWKGNIRELQSVIKRATLLAKSEGRNLLRLKDLLEEIINERTSEINLEEQILELLREKEFSYNSISFTADAVGGLNRGTVSEYFRGFCFKVFYESGWDIQNAVNTISQTSSSKVQSRVEKKFYEYIKNAVQKVDRTKTIDEVMNNSRPKFKNLPQKYHRYLNEMILSYYNKKWELKK